MEPSVNSPAPDAWKNIVLPAAREQNAFSLFEAMHPNPWAVPDLLFQAALLESEIFHTSKSSSQYLNVVERVRNFLYLHRGALYQEYIYGFGAFVLREFLQDRRMPLLPRPPIPFLPRYTPPLPTFQLPPASPIPNLILLDNMQQAPPNFRQLQGFFRSRL